MAGKHEFLLKVPMLVDRWSTAALKHVAPALVIIDQTCAKYPLFIIEILSLYNIEIKQ